MFIPTGRGGGGGDATISIKREGSDVVITFTGTLQSADVVTEPYTDVAGATNPRKVTSGATAQKYWRTKK